MSSITIQEKSNKPQQKVYICWKDLATFSRMTKLSKGRTDLLQNLFSILLNHKDTKEKKLLIEKIDSIILNDKNIK